MTRASAAAMTQQLRQLPGFSPDDFHYPLPQEYARDSWPPSIKSAPTGSGAILALPRSNDQVATLLRWASKAGHSVSVQGGRSNVVGALAGEDNIVLSLERMNRVLSLDIASQTVRVEAGILGGQLEETLAQDALTLGHYPQSLCISTVGGWVSMRATGTYSARYGGIEKLVCGLTVVMTDGAIHGVPARVRPSGGLDLTALLCGSEGSIGVITEVALAVQRRLPEKIVCASFPTFAEGLAAQRELVQTGYPIALMRLCNEAESRAIVPPEMAQDFGCLMIVTTMGPTSLVDSQGAAIKQALLRFGATLRPEAAAQPWFDHRYAEPGFMETRNALSGTVFDTIEASVPWAAATACAAELETSLGSLSQPYFLHASHVYATGTCLYMVLFLQGSDDEDALRMWNEAWTLALAIIASHGGAIGHHHGIGQARRQSYASSSEGLIHAKIKHALDPKGILRANLLDRSVHRQGAAEAG